MLILPETDDRTAFSIGRRVRRDFKESAPGGLTLSMGVARFQKDFDAEAFIRLADDRMYKNKEAWKELRTSWKEARFREDNCYVRV